MIDSEFRVDKTDGELPGDLGNSTTQSNVPLAARRVLRVFLAVAVAIVGAFVLLVSFVLASHQFDDVAPYVATAGTLMLAAAYGIANARSTAWFLTSMVVGGLFLLAVLSGFRLLGGLA